MKPITRWNWIFDPESMTFSYRDPGGPSLIYDPDLGRFDTCANVLDWMIQVSDKPWCTDACLADFVRLVDHVLDLQGNLCSWGRDRGRIDPVAIARHSAGRKPVPPGRFHLRKGGA